MAIITLIGEEEWNLYIRDPESSDLIQLFISGNRDFENLQPFAGLGPNFVSINFFSTPISSLVGLNEFSNLKSLNLSRTRIIDAQLIYISDLIQLTRLELNGNNISDIRAISGLTKLTKLGLACTFVINLSPLISMRQLQVLDIYQTPIKDIFPILNLPIHDLDRRISRIELHTAQQLLPNAEII